jgi:butyrate kinase
LDRSPACCKATTYTQNNTKREYRKKDIHASVGIRTRDPNIERAERYHALNSAATAIAVIANNVLKRKRMETAVTKLGVGHYPGNSLEGLK